MQLIGNAVAKEAQSLGIRRLLLAYDGRLSSAALSSVLTDSLLQAGCDVIDLGLAPTPLLYFATHTTEFDSGVMLTASHNPADYNGIKIVFKRNSVTESQIQSIRQRIVSDESGDTSSTPGHYTQLDVKNEYLQTVCSKISLERNLRVVIDCGNAVPAVIAPELFSQFGCDVIPLFCEVDGNFPNHHPDPTIASNLVLLAEKVRETGADIGLAFDGDGDRLGAVTNKGEFIGADQLLILLARDIVPRYPDAPIVFDVKCSRSLADEIASLGGKPVMYRSGHSFMKQKMQETSAPLGGEYSAHIFIKDRWYGFDDGIYAGARILELLARQSLSSSELFADLLRGVSTPEYSIAIADENKFALMDKIISKADFPDAELITLDGLRVEFERGWGLVRASNTSPALLLRFEAEDETALAEIKQQFKALIRRADKTIDLNAL